MLSRPSFGLDICTPPQGAFMARENLASLISDLKARMTTIRDSL